MHLTSEQIEIVARRFETFPPRRAHFFYDSDEYEYGSTNDAQLNIEHG